MKPARELRASGSNIVIDGDLAPIFRQSRIDAKFEYQFRKDVTKGSRLSIFSNIFPMALLTGPGATVGGVLRDTDYLPFVIQASLLCAVHDIESLAMD